MSEFATFSVTLPDEAATAHLMADLALLLGAGDVITLTGDLGAGKTTAARAMIRYLADDDGLEVPSPTFTLVQAYDLPSFPLLHADLYRIADASELEEIGVLDGPVHWQADLHRERRAPAMAPSAAPAPPPSSPAAAAALPVRSRRGRRQRRWQIGGSDGRYAAQIGYDSVNVFWR